MRTGSRAVPLSGFVTGALREKWPVLGRQAFDPGSPANPTSLDRPGHILDVIIGRRLDYIDGYPAAAIVYKRRQHAINVLVWPADTRDTRDASAEPQTHQMQGYSLIHWRDAGLDYLAVSTVSLDELKQFVSLLHQPTAATRPSQ